MESICEHMARSRTQGFEPIAVLMNNTILKELKKEVAQKATYPIMINSVLTIFGLSIIVHPKVKDFFIVDNRSWVYQKF